MLIEASVHKSKLSSKPSYADQVSASAAKLRLLKKLRCTLNFEKRAWAAGANSLPESMRLAADRSSARSWPPP
jgi:hypothetical protein